MELLIDLTGRVGSASPDTDWQAGDVIVVCPDGWPWSETERTNPRWLILKCPTLARTEGDSMMAPMLPLSLTPGERLQRRQFQLGPIALAALKQSGTTTVTLLQLRAMRALKSRLQ